MKRLLKKNLFQHQFNQLAAGFMEFSSRQECQVVLFTAALPREGVTSITREFSRVLQIQSGRRVLLIDASPSTVRQQPSKKAKKIDTAVEENPWSAIYGTSYGFDTISVWLDDATGYSQNINSLSRVLEKLKKKYDYLVVDASPVLEMSSTSIWLNLVQALYLVIASGKTRQPVIERALAVIQKKPVTLIGTILNGRQYPIPDPIYHWLYK